MLLISCRGRPGVLGRTMSGDPKGVQQIMGEEQPLIYTVTPYYYAAAGSDLANVRPTALSYYRVSWNAEELYFKK